MFSEAVQFWLLKRLRGDDFLRQDAVSWEDLNKMLDGRTVALVGNARSLATGQLGAEIDSFDIVIRLNDAPMPSSLSHGARTDWMAVAKTVAKKNLAARKPQVLLWMPSQRKRLTYPMVKAARFYLNPPERNDVLRARLNAPPSLGCMMIDLLGLSRVGMVRLFGFDFFASRSLSGSRTVEQVPHDFSAEAAWVKDLLENDPRFSRAEVST